MVYCGADADVRVLAEVIVLEEPQSGNGQRIKSCRHVGIGPNVTDGVRKAGYQNDTLGVECERRWLSADTTEAIQSRN